MHNRLISLIITIAFVLTQCGLGSAASEKMGTVPYSGDCPHFFKNLRARAVGDDRQDARAAGIGAELGKAEPAQAAGNAAGEEEFRQRLSDMPDSELVKSAETAIRMHRYFLYGSFGGRFIEDIDSAEGIIARFHTYGYALSSRERGRLSAILLILWYRDHPVDMEAAAMVTSTAPSSNQAAKLLLQRLYRSLSYRLQISKRRKVIAVTATLLASAGIGTKVALDRYSAEPVRVPPAGTAQPSQNAPSVPKITPPPKAAIPLPPRNCYGIAYDSQRENAVYITRGGLFFWNSQSGPQLINRWGEGLMDMGKIRQTGQAIVDTHTILRRFGEDVYIAFPQTGELCYVSFKDSAPVIKAIKYQDGKNVYVHPWLSYGPSTRIKDMFISPNGQNILLYIDNPLRRMYDEHDKRYGTSFTKRAWGPYAMVPNRGVLCFGLDLSSMRVTTNVPEWGPGSRWEALIPSEPPYNNPEPYRPWIIFDADGLYAYVFHPGAGDHYRCQAIRLSDGRWLGSIVFPKGAEYPWMHKYGVGFEIKGHYYEWSLGVSQLSRLKNGSNLALVVDSRHEFPHYGNSSGADVNGQPARAAGAAGQAQATGVPMTLDEMQAKIREMQTSANRGDFNITIIYRKGDNRVQARVRGSIATAIDDGFTCYRLFGGPDFYVEYANLAFVGSKEEADVWQGLTVPVQTGVARAGLALPADMIRASGSYRVAGQPESVIVVVVRGEQEPLAARISRFHIKSVNHSLINESMGVVGIYINIEDSLPGQPITGIEFRTLPDISRVRETRKELVLLTINPPSPGEDSSGEIVLDCSSRENEQRLQVVMTALLAHREVGLRFVHLCRTNDAFARLLPEWLRRDIFSQMDTQQNIRVSRFSVTNTAGNESQAAHDLIASSQSELSGILRRLQICNLVHQTTDWSHNSIVQQAAVDLKREILGTLPAVGMIRVAVVDDLSQGQEIQFVGQIRDGKMEMLILVKDLSILGPGVIKYMLNWVIIGQPAMNPNAVSGSRPARAAGIGAELGQAATTAAAAGRWIRGVRQFVDQYDYFVQRYSLTGAPSLNAITEELYKPDPNVEIIRTIVTSALAEIEGKEDLDPLSELLEGILEYLPTVDGGESVIDGQARRKHEVLSAAANARTKKRALTEFHSIRRDTVLRAGFTIKKILTDNLYRIIAVDSRGGVSCELIGKPRFLQKAQLTLTRQNLIDESWQYREQDPTSARAAGGSAELGKGSGVGAEGKASGEVVAALGVLAKANAAAREKDEKQNIEVRVVSSQIPHKVRGVLSEVLQNSGLASQYMLSAVGQAGQARLKKMGDKLLVDLHLSLEEKNDPQKAKQALVALLGGQGAQSTLAQQPEKQGLEIIYGSELSVQERQYFEIAIMMFAKLRPEIIAKVDMPIQVGKMSFSELRRLLGSTADISTMSNPSYRADGGLLIMADAKQQDISVRLLMDPEAWADPGAVITITAHELLHGYFPLKEKIGKQIVARRGQDGRPAVTMGSSLDEANTYRRTALFLRDLLADKELDLNRKAPNIAERLRLWQQEEERRAESWTRKQARAAGIGAEIRQVVTTAAAGGWAGEKISRELIDRYRKMNELYGNIAILQVRRNNRDCNYYYSLRNSPQDFKLAFESLYPGLFTDYPPFDLETAMTARSISVINFSRAVFQNAPPLISACQRIENILLELAGKTVTADDGRRGIWYRGPKRYNSSALVFNMSPDGKTVTVATYAELKPRFYDFLRGRKDPKIGELKGVEIVSARAAGRTILVVDDDELVRDSYGEYLELEGFHVVKADSGEQAMDIFNENPAAIDLVVTDFSMVRGMNGVQLAEEIKRIRRVPVMLISGNPPSLTGEVDKVMQKPVNMRTIVREIETLLSQQANAGAMGNKQPQFEPTKDGFLKVKIGSRAWLVGQRGDVYIPETLELAEPQDVPENMLSYEEAQRFLNNAFVNEASRVLRAPTISFVRGAVSILKEYGFKIENESDLDELWRHLDIFAKTRRIIEQIEAGETGAAATGWNDLRVLVVDDELGSRESIYWTLVAKGVPKGNIFKVPDAVSAEDFVEKNQVDVVISDWKMPSGQAGKEGGQALIEHITAIQGDKIPVILLAAVADQRDVATLSAVEQAIIKAYVGKPFGKAELCAAIEKAVPALTSAQAGATVPVTGQGQPFSAQAAGLNILVITDNSTTAVTAGEEIRYILDESGRIERVNYVTVTDGSVEEVNSVARAVGDADRIFVHIASSNASGIFTALNAMGVVYANVTGLTGPELRNAITESL